MTAALRMWGLGSRLAVRPRVVLLAFADNAIFEPHELIMDAERREVAGYLRQSNLGNWIGYRENDPRGRLVAHHVYGSTLLAEEFQRAPSCIKVGLAAYLSTFAARSDRAEFGHDQPRLRNIAQSSPLFSADDLFAMSDASQAALKDDGQDRFIAESWALVEYLARSGDPWPQLRQLAHATATGTPPRAAFAAAYPQESWEGLEDRLRRYMRDEKPEPRQIVFGSPLEAIGVKLRAPARGEVPAQIALWRAKNGDPDPVEAALQDSLSAVPDLPLARAARGVMMVDEFPPNVVVSELRAASRPGTRDALTLSVAGLTLMRLALHSDRASRKPLLREAGDVLERSLAADSSDARALAGFVECRVRSRDLTPLVVARLERVAPSVPDDPDIQRFASAVARHAVPDALDAVGDVPEVEELPEAIEKVPPDYPELARSKGIEGEVVVYARIGEDGRVEAVRIKKSIPELDEYAMGAVRQWRFRPAMSRGQPVRVWVEVPVRFSLR